MSLDVTLLRVPARLDRLGVDAVRAGIAGAIPGGMIVLRSGDPSTFCAGLDLERFGELEPAALREGLQQYAALLLAIAEAPMPVIAVVEGDAFGGGVGIAASADLVIATPGARFGLPEARYGFFPAIVFAVLDLRLTPQRSRRLALQCESIDAPTAREYGLVDEVVAADALDASLSRWVRRLARAVPQAVAAMRAHAPHRDRLRASLDAGVEATAQALSRPDVRAAIAEALR